MESEAFHLLSSSHPFVFISLEQRKNVASKMRRLPFAAGEVVLRHGSGCRDMFIVQKGFLDITYYPTRFDTQHTGSVQQISANAYFGERSALFEELPNIKVIAKSDSVVYVLPYNVVIHMLRCQEVKFVVALANDLREKHGIFRDFEIFHTDLLPGLVRGQVAFPKVLHAYRLLNPAIHRDMNSRELDIDAWSYALRRLPTNITSVYAVVLSKRLMDVLRTEESTAEVGKQTCSIHAPGHPVPTHDRRRTSWEVAPGKLFVLVRGDVDILDFISCLCLHTVEMQKMRALLKPIPRIMAVVRRALDRKHSSADPDAVDKEAISEIAQFTGNNVDGIRTLWPGKASEIIMEALVHHGDYSVFVPSNLDDRGVTEREQWIARVRSNVIAMVGDLEDPSLPPLVVDIMSSNTHSVVNLLSPYLHQHRREILEWGAAHSPETMAAPFRFEMDRIYALSMGFFAANPAMMEERGRVDREHGIITLAEQEFTGITVQLVNLHLLRKMGGTGYVDDNIDMRFMTDSQMATHRHLLVNIDYAFGEQARHILQSLILLFNHSVRSVNVMGKAGALVGKRGDILFPSHLIFEASTYPGELRSVSNEDMSPQQLHIASCRDVHVGPVLTVMGTVLQNERLLRFYSRLWQVTGLEMEGSYYLKCIEHNLMLGLLRPDLRSRFLYYVSDLPLSIGTSLARKMSAWEGIPPLYAITRALIDKVLLPYDPRQPTHTPSLPFLPGVATVRLPTKWQAVRHCVTSAGTLRKGKMNPVAMWCPISLRRTSSIIDPAEQETPPPKDSPALPPVARPRAGSVPLDDAETKPKRARESGPDGNGVAAVV